MGLQFQVLSIKPKVKNFFMYKISKYCLSKPHLRVSKGVMYLAFFGAI